MEPLGQGTFSDYLKAIAMGATWYLEHVYTTTGYNAQPEPVEESAPNKWEMKVIVEPNDPWDEAVEA